MSTENPLCKQFRNIFFIYRTYIQTTALVISYNVYAEFIAYVCYISQISLPRLRNTFYHHSNNSRLLNPTHSVIFFLEDMNSPEELVKYSVQILHWFEYNFHLKLYARR